MREENKQKLERYRAEFENCLAQYLKEKNYKPEILGESMRYSLSLGGKRLRPVFMFACAEMLGGKIQDVKNFALALEMIHTYSLIHDDLPAMDNDDFRRGKPSNHKQFGEGQAILAGDALLNEGYEICFAECKKGRTYIKAAQYLCMNAGASGMVAGQAADLFYEGKEVGSAEVEFIIYNKTARMIMSALAVPAYMYGTDENIISILAEFGKNLGFLFQITDDILDLSGDFKKLGKTVGKDVKEKKVSSVNVYGLEKCKKMADRYAEVCVALLNQLPFESGFFQDIVSFIRDREA